MCRQPQPRCSPGSIRWRGAHRERYQLAVANLPAGDVLPSGLRSTGNLVLAAITTRTDPRDALVCRMNETVTSVLAKKGARIGTSSHRKTGPR
ncbi:MAG: hypothetical protein EBZ48_00495 [Proteobacteria bacterium]|nr:hypothetical protein [Pseudomonadota bacterium]